MPNARVGAMPQSQRDGGSETAHHGHHSAVVRNRNRRQQGITMQDLKQRTALRLAQEQQQQRRETGGNAEGQEALDDTENFSGLSLNTEEVVRFTEAVLNENDPHKLPPLSSFQMGPKNSADLQQFADGPLPNIGNVTNWDDSPLIGKPDSFTRTEHSDSISSLGEEGGLSEMAEAIVSEHDEGTGRCRGTFSMIGGRVRNPRGNPPGVSPAKNFFPSFPSIYRSQNGQQGNTGTIGKVSRKKEEKKRNSRENGHDPVQVLTPENHNVLRGAGVTGAPQVEHHHIDGKPFHRTLVGPATPNSSAHSGRESSQNNVRNSNRQSKLPHGLTVQELKEMTKARLAAEASDPKEQDGRQRSQFLPMQPSGFNPGQSPNRGSVGISSPHAMTPDGFNRENRLSRGQHPSFPFTRQRINSVESTASAPPVIYQPTTPNTLLRSNSSHLMLEDHFSGISSQQIASLKGVASDHNLGIFHSSSVGSHDSSSIPYTQPQQTQLHSGKWHRNTDSTGSNRMMQYPEGFRSEFSAFSTTSPEASVHPSPNASMDEQMAMFFNRSRSYPDNNIPFDTNVPSLSKTNGTLLDLPPGIAQGSNRRRTWTTSPRLGHLWEDHPVSLSSRAEEELFKKRSFTGSTETDLPLGFSASFRSLDPATSPQGSRVSTPTSTRFSSSSGVIGDSRHQPIQAVGSNVIAPRFVAAGDGNATEASLMMGMGLSKERDDLTSILADLPDTVAGVAENVLENFQEGGRWEELEKNHNAPPKSTGLTGVFRSLWGAPGHKQQSSKGIAKGDQNIFSDPRDQAETDLSSSTWETSQLSDSTNCATIGFLNDSWNRVLRPDGINNLTEQGFDRLGPSLVSRIDPEVPSHRTPLFGADIGTVNTPVLTTAAPEFMLSVDLVSDNDSGMSPKGPPGGLNVNVVSVSDPGVATQVGMLNERSVEMSEGQTTEISNVDCQQVDNPNPRFGFPGLKLPKKTSTRKTGKRQGKKG